MMATNDSVNSSGGSGDSGPAVRRMSPEVRGHARGVILAEAVGGTAGKGPEADRATLGRDGFEGAPPPLKKRWTTVAAGLAVAAAGAAIIVGSGVISGDDIGISPADTSQDEASNGTVDDSDPDRNLDLLRTRVTCLSDAGAASDDISPVVYEHQSEGYTMVAVDYGIPQMCATTNFGGSHTSTRAEGSGEVQQFIRHTTPLDDTYTELLGGKVADDVTAVDIQSDGDVVASANLENGWFSAFATTQPGAELSYLVTLQDGNRKTVVIDDPLYVSPAEQQGANDDFLSGFADDCFDEGYQLISTHRDPNYLFFAANTGDTVQGCVNGPDQISAGSLPAEMAFGAPIEPIDPKPEPTGTGTYPVMGRAAPNVTEVVVVLADGKRRDAFVHDGFYSLLLPATDAVDVTYVVETDDGQTSTIGSD